MSVTQCPQFVVSWHGFRRGRGRTLPKGERFACMFAHTDINVHPTWPVNRILAGEQHTHTHTNRGCMMSLSTLDVATPLVLYTATFVLFVFFWSLISEILCLAEEILINFNCYSPKDFISVFIYLVVHVQHEEVWVSGRIWSIFSNCFSHQKHHGSVNIFIFAKSVGNFCLNVSLLVFWSSTQQLSTRWDLPECKISVNRCKRQKKK